MENAKQTETKETDGIHPADRTNAIRHLRSIAILAIQCAEVLEGTRKGRRDDMGGGYASSPVPGVPGVPDEALAAQRDAAIERAERAEKIIEDLCGVEVDGTIIVVFSRDQKGQAFPNALVVGLLRACPLPTLYVVMEATERAPKVYVGMRIRANGRDGRYTWGTSDGGVVRRVFEATSIEILS